MKRVKSGGRGLKLFAKTLWRVVLINWRVSPKLYVAQAVMTTIQGLLPLVNAFIIAKLLGGIADRFVTPGPIEPLLWLLVGAAAVQFVMSQMSYWSFYLDDMFGMQFDLHIQRTLFNKLYSLDQSYYEDQAFNNQLNKITQNIFSMRSLNRNFLMAGNSVVQLLSTAVALVAFEPLIALAITVGLIPVLVIEVKTSMKQWRSWDERGNDWRLQWYLRGVLTNVISLREIKLYGLRDYLIQRWEKHFKAGRLAQLGIERRAQRLRAMAGVLDLAVTYGSYGWLVVRVLQRGTGLDSFVFYRQVIENYASAGSGLVRNLHTMQENSLYVNDYFAFMELLPRLPEAERPARLKLDGAPPRVEFETVTFRYPGSDRDVLKKLSFVVEPGEGLAIVGANGAGKTTIIKLLLRLYDPTTGRILIDGRDLRELDLAAWYRRVGALFQDFNRYDSLSVSDNVAMGRPERRPTARTLEAATTEAGAKAFIEAYPKKYEQILNRSYEDGMEPSGGQWQRIALARAFYRSADVLILDEPTSAIDAKGEYEIFKRLAKSQRGKTTIIISHRFSTVRNARKIIVLERGRITESGSHEELAALKGRYHELFELQAEGYR